MTNRRSLLRASAATWLGAWLAIAKGQNVIRRVAYLGVSAGPYFDLFRSRLGELGWVEDRTLVLDRRFTHGDGALISPLTAELLALRPDVFVAARDTMAIAAAASTATVPIVFAVGTDPVRSTASSNHSPNPVATSPASASAALNWGRSACRCSKRLLPD